MDAAAWADVLLTTVAGGIILALLAGYAAIWKRLVSIEGELTRLKPVAKLVETYGTVGADRAFRSGHTGVVQQEATK